MHLISAAAPEVTRAIAPPTPSFPRRRESRRHRGHPRSQPRIPAVAGTTKRQTTPQCIPLPQSHQGLTPTFASAYRSPFNLPYPLPHPPRRAATGECTVRGGQMGGAGAFPPWARLGSAPQKRRPARRFGKPIVPRPFGLTLKLIRGRAASGCCPPKGRQRRGKQRPGPTPPEAQARATVRP